MPEVQAIVEDMRQACARSEGGGQPFIQVCAEVAEAKIAEVIAGMRVDEGDLTFDQFSTVNRTRSRQRHKDGTHSWSGADWSNAMCGEAGEAANVVKKLRRLETGVVGFSQEERSEWLLEKLGEELADTICYLDLLAAHYGIDLELALRGKFNKVSERQGFKERL